MTKDSVDKFFDALDNGADKLVGALKGVHYPGKEEDEAEDAEFRDVATSFRLGAEHLADKRGHYWHILRDAYLVPLCQKRSTMVAFKHLTPSEGGFYAVCIGCLARLIAFQTQSQSDVAVKELTDGR